MKYLLLIIPFVCFGNIANAGISGKLDITSDPSAIALRDLHDGLWLIGMQKNIFKLVDTKKDREILHLSFFVASRLEGQAVAYGPSLGTNVGSLVSSLAGKISLLQAVSDATPPWLGKIADWTSLDVYGGYRPVITFDEHRWMYGVGGQIRVPFGSVVRWAQGERNDGTVPDKKGL